MAETTACRERQVVYASLGGDQWALAPIVLLSRATHGYWMSLCPGFLADIAGKPFFQETGALQSNSKKWQIFFLAFLSFPFLR